MIAAAGLFAPTIRYHNGTFYIACTNVACEGSDFAASNFYIFSKDITRADSWSDPIPLALHGIDPSIFIDPADGRAYVQGSWRLPRTEQPTSTIKQWEIDLATGKELSPIREIWEGQSRIYTEGPHMYAKDGWYYLLVAEGGTFEHHHLSLARSRSIWGPFEPCPSNPVLTSYGTSESIRDAGHGELFQDSLGRWWAVVLAVRKGRNGTSDRYPLGRESFLTPVSWPKGDWPTIDHPQLCFRRGLISPSPTKLSSLPDPVPEVSDCYIRLPELSDYQWGGAVSTSSNSRDVRVRASKTNLSVGNGTTTFTGQRQRRLEGSSVSATIDLKCLRGRSSRNGLLRAGVAVYKDDLRFATVGIETSATVQSDIAVVVDLKNNAPVRQIASTKGGLAAGVDMVSLTITAKGDKYEFSYQEISHAESSREMEISNGSGIVRPVNILGEVDMIEMSERDFTGTIFGLFANEDGEDMLDSDKTWVSFRCYRVNA